MDTQKEKFALDSTLRYLVYSLMEQGGQLLAIKFIYRGKTWYADTPTEAIELRRQLEKADVQKAIFPLHDRREYPGEEEIWSADRIADLLEGIGPLQKRFLEILLIQPSVEAEEMASLLGLSSQIALAGMLSGLSKQVRAMDLSPTMLYHANTTWQQKSKQRFFSVTPAFRIGAHDSGLFGVKSQKRSTDAASTNDKRK